MMKRKVGVIHGGTLMGACFVNLLQEAECFVVVRSAADLPQLARKGESFAFDAIVVMDDTSAEGFQSVGAGRGTLAERTVLVSAGRGGETQVASDVRALETDARLDLDRSSAVILATFRDLLERGDGSCGASDVSLNERERDVLVMLGRGLSSRETAHELGVVPGTVDAYRRRIQSKLKLDSAALLTRYCISHGLIEASERLPSDLTALVLSEESW